MSNMNQHVRRLPYLHRNWIAAVNYWQSTGLGLPTPSRHPGDGSLDYGYDHYSRSAKRRRFLEDPADADLGTNDLDGFLLPGDRDQLEKALRIEVLKIDHKDSSRIKFNGILNGLIPPQAKDVIDSKARCRISISCNRDGEAITLHVDSQICTLKTYKNPVGPSHTTRIYLPQPFHVPQEKILVDRDDDDVFSLADSYTVLIELESAGEPNWLPQNLGPNFDEHIFETPQPRQWVLSASVAEMFHRHRKAVPLRLKRRLPHKHDTATDFVLDVDVRWTSGLSSARMARRLEKGVLPSITVVDPSDEPPTVNGHTTAAEEDLVNGDGGRPLDGHMNGDLEEMDEQEGELTPSRSRRARHQINYNLKLLSDQAAGRERRRRRKAAAAAAGQRPEHAEECKITYLLPPEQFSVEDFSCCLCGAPHQSISQLRAHLLGHGQYDFDFDSRPRGSVHVSVTHISSTPTSPIRSKVYQLGRPMKPFDLAKYVDGDNSWALSRLGPENDCDLGPKRTVVPKVTQDMPPPLLPPPPPPTTTTTAGRRQQRKKIFVPSNIKQPLFDPLSKVRLEPGSELRPYVADDSWLIQKHRDTVLDFVDIDDEEKEYITTWDAFVLKEHVTSGQYLARAFLSFVKERAPWIVAKKFREQEFAKHMLALCTRDAIDEYLMSTAFRILEETRARGLPPQEPGEPPEPKLSSGCAICGKLVAGPAYLVCSEFNCTKRLYHDYCVVNPKVPTDNKDFWKCNNCAS